MAFPHSFLALEPAVSEGSSQVQTPESESNVNNMNGNHTPPPGGDRQRSSLAVAHGVNSGSSTTDLPHSPAAAPNHNRNTNNSHATTGEGIIKSETSRHQTPLPNFNSDGPDRLASDEGASAAMGGAFKTTPAKAALKKKRGTASVIKAPKRSRGGGRGGGGGIGRRGRSGGGRKKSIGGGGEGGSSPGPSSSMVGNSSGAESDSGPYCLCRGPDDHKFMIACDRCEDWFHGACIGMDKYTGEVLVQKYICPNCRVDGLYLTRYKKMCSLEGCDQPARIYNPEDRSIFCTEEHCQQWWEQLIATLPKSKKGDSGGSLEVLTQEEFMGLLGPPGKGNKDAWKLSKKPFGVPKDFWETVDCNRALTDEERHMLETSAAERYALGEEMVLCKKMLQLLEMATKRREAAIAAGRGTTKDLCGYDIRLDTIGVAHQFSVFLQSPQGEAIFKAGRLDAPSPSELAAATAAVATNNNEITRTGGAGGYENGIKEADPLTAGMCIKKKCKPHAQWGVILTKDVRHAIKELAAQAKEKLDTEERVRESAASRFARKSRESSSAVTVCRGESESAGDYGSGDGDDETMDDDGDDEGDDGAAAENRGDEVMT